MHEIDAFGNYEPITPLKFQQGQPISAAFYCEVDGFQSQMNEKQLWETKLSLELRLFSPTASFRYGRHRPHR